MMPSLEHFLLKRRNALSTFSFSPTLTVDIFQPSFADAFIFYYVIIATLIFYVKSFLGVFLFFGNFSFDKVFAKLSLARLNLDLAFSTKLNLDFTLSILHGGDKLLFAPELLPLRSN